MSNEKVSQLPTVTNAALGDIIYAIQGGISSQETLQQVFNLMLANTVLHNAGNPNGLVAGSIYQLLWDTTNSTLYICTMTGNAASAVWTQVSTSFATTVKPAQGGTGVSSPTAHTIPVAEGSADFNFLGPLTNGQILIGITGSDPTPTTLTAGTGISVVNNPGSITIAATGSSAFMWTVVTGTSQAMAGMNGYIPNNAGLVTFTLPATANVGDIIRVVGLSSSGWTIAQNGGQVIHYDGLDTTVGAGGSLSSTVRYDAVELLCTVVDTDFTVISSIGNLTVV